MKNLLSVRSNLLRISSQVEAFVISSRVSCLRFELFTGFIDFTQKKIGQNKIFKATFMKKRLWIFQETSQSKVVSNSQSKMVFYEFNRMQ